MGYLVPFLLVTYVASGWGYLISTLVPPKHGPFISSLVVFIVCCVLGDPERLNDFLDGGVFQMIVSLLSITRWSVAMNVNFQVDTVTPQTTTVAQQVVLHKVMLSIGYWWTGLIFLLLQGTLLRM